MQYVTVSLKVDNPSSQDFNGYWGDYLRLKSGTITSPPNDATLPLGFVAAFVRWYRECDLCYASRQHFLYSDLPEHTFLPNAVNGEFPDGMIA